MEKQIQNILYKNGVSTERAVKLTGEIMGLFYDPSARVTTVNENFKKRVVDDGTFYKFKTNGEWDQIWHFAPKTNTK